MHITGKVIKGNKKATVLGFPTANIELKDQHVSPGIYAGRVEIDGEYYKTALYVGKINPNILEAHILDFNGDLYDKEIKLQICDKIRDDFNVEDESKLREMITNDIEMIRIELDKGRECLPE